MAGRSQFEVIGCAIFHDFYPPHSEIKRKDFQLQTAALLSSWLSASLFPSLRGLVVENQNFEALEAAAPKPLQPVLDRGLTYLRVVSKTKSMDRWVGMDPLSLEETGAFSLLLGIMCNLRYLTQVYSIDEMWKEDEDIVLSLMENIVA